MAKNSGGLTYDFSQLEKMYGQFEKDRFHDYVRDSLTLASSYIINNAKAALKGQLKTSGYNPRYSDTVLDGYIIKYHAKEENKPYVTLSALGTRSKSSGGFRTRFLDGGTQDRSYITKSGKPHNLGSLGTKGILQNAIAQGESTALNILRKRLEDEINRINDKNYKE